ncbi:FAD-dependent oxidoreductase [Deinococcus peraridilitoris]|uniref:NAD(FAD)-dependent dehydrogenase n=1 Tax=Deinococcus peraridilitoris (strain DSM 19664 / LMG 22246 / CIP 109416 / KR-200) TaxID=937777 RepID=L0A9G1_DEIPD|nr:FAD-dependent oxidoreductase [Deinococcus peraridilitoris]AFZ69680.1 NAD(FAD)-dependent dehydrogenase [Deinococcus peraridilitoris DSM 19664]
MKRPRFLVIGADAAGMSAASEARRVNPELQITAFDKGNFASYSQCGMPYWLGGVVKRREQLMARSVAGFARRDIEVRLRHEVLEIDTQRQVLHVRDLEARRVLVEPFDHLLIATGASPVEFPLPGRDLAGVFHLDVLEDAIRIDAFLQGQQPRRAVIVGGGYIGLELAENLTRRGLQVALVQRGEQVFHAVDQELAEALHEELDRHGVNLKLRDSIVRACAGQDGRVREVQTNDGNLAADLVILATGVQPNVDLALRAGIPFGVTGALAVDAHMKTSAAGVYAAGDCAEHYHRVLGKPVWIPLGTTANKQGRVAGRNAAGGKTSFAGIVATAVAQVFELGVARTGLNEWEAQAAGLKCETVLLKSTDQAGYMPGAEDLRVKLVVERGTGRLLGGQAIGKRGADKRIDVLATALYAGMTVSQLEELDLAYAPPFNSVWDPVQAAATRIRRQG